MVVYGSPTLAERHFITVKRTLPRGKAKRGPSMGRGRGRGDSAMSVIAFGTNGKRNPRDKWIFIASTSDIIPSLWLLNGSQINFSACLQFWWNLTLVKINLSLFFSEWGWKCNLSYRDTIKGAVFLTPQLIALCVCVGVKHLFFWRTPYLLATLAYHITTIQSITEAPQREKNSLSESNRK